MWLLWVVYSVMWMGLMWWLIRWVGGLFVVCSVMLVLWCVRLVSLLFVCSLNCSCGCLWCRVVSVGVSRLCSSVLVVVRCIVFVVWLGWVWVVVCVVFSVVLICLVWVVSVWVSFSVW